ncbi:uncharacterized protein [Pocillopora verrucosa]|uniref:uncharacterized protein n=1 Tax=Pocillopora verrucosa TaxID=203993 RepID=UPI00333FDCAE
MFMDIKMDSQTADAVEMHEHETKGASEGDVSSKKTKRGRKWKLLLVAMGWALLVSHAALVCGVVALFTRNGGSTPPISIYEKPHPVKIQTKYQLWNLGQSGLVVLNNDGTVDCKGTFGAAGIMSYDNTSACIGCIALGVDNLLLVGDATSRTITGKNIDNIDGNDESFEPDYFWSFTMFKHHNSGLYMGCDNSRNAKLFEGQPVEYPDPQILFVLTKVD